MDEMVHLQRCKLPTGYLIDRNTIPHTHQFRVIRHNYDGIGRLYIKKDILARAIEFRAVIDGNPELYMSNDLQELMTRVITLHRMTQ